jgi:hypothetical protein
MGDLGSVQIKLYKFYQNSQMRTRELQQVAESFQEVHSVMAYKRSWTKSLLHFPQH